MSLHPQARAYLDRTGELEDDAQRALTPEQARKSHTLSMADAGDPEPLTVVDDRKIAGPHGDIPVRIYIPEETTPLPVLVYFHGGGWVVGNLETCDVALRAIARRAGCAIVSVDYRLSPENKFPVPLEDGFAGTEWVATHGHDAGLDPSRVAVGGDSAGGNMAAAVTLMARERGAPEIVYQVLIYPVIDLNFDTESYKRLANGYGLTRTAMQWYWGHYLASADQGGSPLASLSLADVSGVPPALVITAEYDPLLDEGEAYARKLEAAGVDARLSRYEGIVHGFLRHGASFDASHRAYDEIAITLRKAFGL